MSLSCQSRGTLEGKTSLSTSISTQVSSGSPGDIEGEKFQEILEEGSYRKARTLARSVSLAGRGLFTGEEVKLCLHPAPRGTGVVFCRADLLDKPLIPARLEYVKDTPRCTILGKGAAVVQTVEHLLATVRAFQLDDVLIEITGPEVPILDGSAKGFVQLIEEGGVKEEEDLVEILRIREPLFWSQGETHIVALPAEEYRISYTLHYPHAPLIGSQFYSFVLEEGAFKEEIAACRTFCLYEEIAPLIEKGWLKGGSPDNALIIQGDKVLNPEGARFKDEMVRHKILDVIGDLSLVAFPFYAHIIAIRSGHQSNTAFAKEIVQHIITCTQRENP